MKRSRLMLAAGLLLAVTVVGMPGRAHHTWVNYHWPRPANPVVLPYKVSIANPTTWGTLVNKVTYEWGNVYQYKPGTLDAFNFKAVSAGQKFTIDIADFGANGWFGASTINVSPATGHIISAAVQINDFYFKGTYNTARARDHVLCQEVGHVLGLEHNRLPQIFGASCMNDDASTLNLPRFRTPNYHDADQINSNYSHLDPADVGVGYPSPLSIIHIFPAT